MIETTIVQMEQVQQVRIFKTEIEARTWAELNKGDVYPNYQDGNYTAISPKLSKYGVAQIYMPMTED